MSAPGIWFYRESIGISGKPIASLVRTEHRDGMDCTYEIDLGVVHTLLKGGWSAQDYMDGQWPAMIREADKMRKDAKAERYSWRSWALVATALIVTLLAVGSAWA